MQHLHITMRDEGLDFYRKELIDTYVIRWYNTILYESIVSFHKPCSIETKLIGFLLKCYWTVLEDDSAHADCIWRIASPLCQQWSILSLYTQPTVILLIAF